MGTKAHIISHTHWDREWYLTQEQFRIKLVRLIDDLLDAAENNPDFCSFMLDGQAIVVQDYLRVKPHNINRLKHAMERGKIICGPWYILPDELLISGEAHIRNFLAGQKVLKPLGGGMKIAYLPDSFGHPAQMPQILQGLGMDTMVFWRGVSKDVVNTEFYWDAPGGAGRVLCVQMPHGYGNCGRLSADMSQTVPRLNELIASLGSKGTTQTILLMNGSDHIAGQLDIDKVIKEAAKRIPGTEFRLSTMQQFVEELKTELGTLAVHEGEFRSGERSMLLGGTLSTRMAHKQANAQVQALAERVLEPLLAAEKLMGAKDAQEDSITYLWERILENHPHDSICGCSIDEVHREMDARFASILQMEKDMLSDTARRIFSAWPKEGPCGAREVLLFEPTTGGVPSYMELEVGLNPVLVQEVNFTRSIIEDYEPNITHPPLPENVQVVDETGRVIPHVLLGAEKGYESLYQDETLPEIYKINKLRLGLLLPGFSYGLHCLNIQPCPGKAQTAATQEGKAIENEFYKVEWTNGAFTVWDKHSDRVHTHVARLVDKGDAGDEYSYSWPEEDSVYIFEDENAGISKKTLPGIGEVLCVQGVWELPEKLHENRKKREDALVACPLTFTVTLNQGINRIDFALEFTNYAKDHRLQVQFPSGVETSYSESYNTFHVVRRPVQVQVPEDWMEYPQSTHPTHGFISIGNGEQGICACAEGLPEFEAEHIDGQTALNITLLRCVGWLSRTDLLTRKGNGGWTIATPDAQCQGMHSYKFALQFYKGDWRENRSFEILDKFLQPAYAAAARLDAVQATVCKNPLEFLTGLPPQVRISAVKPAENKDGIVVRLVNISDATKTFELPMPYNAVKAGRANLAEQWLEELHPHGGVLHISLPPNAIETIYFIC